MVAMSEIRAPYWINLLPDGKTNVFVYASCRETMGLTQREVADGFIARLGKPELQGFLGKSDKYVLLFPHQNLPQELRGIAEEMAVLTKDRGLLLGGIVPEEKELKDLGCHV